MQGFASADGSSEGEPGSSPPLTRITSPVNLSSPSTSRATEVISLVGGTEHCRSRSISARFEEGRHDRRERHGESGLLVTGATSGIGGATATALAALERGRLRAPLLDRGSGSRRRVARGRGRSEGDIPGIGHRPLLLRVPFGLGHERRPRGHLRPVGFLPCGNAGRPSRGRASQMPTFQWRTSARSRFGQSMSTEGRQRRNCGPGAELPEVKDQRTCGGLIGGLMMLSIKPDSTAPWEENVRGRGCDK